MLRGNFTSDRAVAQKKDTLSGSKGTIGSIQPENIMVDFDGHLYLGDFGLCRINLEREDVVHSHCGSPEYMAAETK